MKFLINGRFLSIAQCIDDKESFLIKSYASVSQKFKSSKVSQKQFKLKSLFLKKAGSFDASR